MNPDDLRRSAQGFISEHSIQELADELQLSRTTLSLWLSGKYKSDPATIEKKLSDYFTAGTISRKDERIYNQILTLLQSAENRETIITALTLRR